MIEERSECQKVAVTGSHSLNNKDIFVDIFVAWYIRRTLVLTFIWFSLSFIKRFDRRFGDNEQLNYVQKCYEDTCINSY